jgi:hypothetical protein
MNIVPWFLIIYLVVYIFFSVRIHRAMWIYFAKYADSENLTEEYHKIMGTNENNMNIFEQKLYWMLMSGKVPSDISHDLQCEARVLGRRLRLNMGFAVFFIMILGYIVYRYAR